MSRWLNISIQVKSQLVSQAMLMQHPSLFLGIVRELMDVENMPMKRFKTLILSSLLTQSIKPFSMGAYPTPPKL